MILSNATPQTTLQNLFLEINDVIFVYSFNTMLLQFMESNIPISNNQTINFYVDKFPPGFGQFKIRNSQLYHNQFKIALVNTKFKKVLFNNESLSPTIFDLNVIELSNHNFKNKIFIINFLNYIINIIKTNFKLKEKRFHLLLKPSTLDELFLIQLITKIPLNELEPLNGKIIVSSNNISLIISDVIHDRRQFYLTNFMKLQEDLKIEKIEEPISIENPTETVIPIRPQEVISNFKKNTATIIPSNISNVAKNLLESIDPNEDKVTVLKKIKMLLTGKDTVTIDDVNNYENLLEQVKNVNVFSKKISFPQDNKTIANPEFLVKIREISGPSRHEFEFGKNIDFSIQSLFNSLEDKNNPIKILNIEKTLEDNNSERYFRYKIKIQNTSSDFKEPYDVYLNIPALINGRYFKLNGKEYIASSQQFLKPITKDKPNEVRFLTNYAMIRVILKNITISPSDLYKLFDYVKIKYTNDLVTDNQAYNEIKFKNGYYFNFLNSPFYKDDVSELVQEGLEVKYKPNNTSIRNKNEFIFDKLSNFISTTYNDNLRTSKKTDVFLQIHILGFKFPFIVYYWKELGLFEALRYLNIDYTVDNIDKTHNGKMKSVQFKNFTLFCYCDNKREEYIVNGLFTLNLLKLSKDDCQSSQGIYDQLKDLFGDRVVNNLNNAKQYMIDPITKDLLQFEKINPELTSILANQCLDKLFNDPVDHPAELGTLRIRNSEYFMNLLYNELCMAHNRYSYKVENKDVNAKIALDDNYLIKNIMGKHAHSSDGSGVIDYINPFSPVDELVKSSKVIKTGKGGLPSKQAARKEHRNVHPSYLGNISANSTPEYADIGLTNHHSLGVIITNKYGNYGKRTIEEIEKNDGWDTLNIDEALIPFVNQIASDRVVLARTHIGQKIPIVNGEPPIIRTGAEYIVPKITSEKFSCVAKSSGKVISVDNDVMVVKYVTGEMDKFDVSTRLSATKRNSIISSSMKSVAVGETFSKDEVIAWSSAFNKNILSNGRNLKTALINYAGYSHEDGYVLSEDATQKFLAEKVVKIPIIIEENIEVISFIKDFVNTSHEDVLFEFKHKTDKSKYLEDIFKQEESTEETSSNEEDLSEDENELEIEGLFNTEAADTIKIMSPGGDIIAIKLRLNVKKNIDPILLAFWKKQEQQIKQKLEVLGVEKSDNVDTSLLKLGGHKYKSRLLDGGLLEVYIRRNAGFNIGDKLSNRFGAKGVITYIVPKKFTPIADHSKELEIFIQVASMIGRKNTAILKELYIGKIIKNLETQLIDMAFRNAPIKEIINHATKLYSILDKYSDGNGHIRGLLEIIRSIGEKNFINKLKTGDIDIAICIPPFKNITYEDIKLAAEHLQIPLDEQVYFPEFDIYSKNKIPVGYAYYGAMEQLASDYESTRSIGKYVSATGQPTKGKTRIGGQSIGNYDLFCFLSYGNKDLIKELFTVRSDNMRAKQDVLNNLRRYGIAYMPQEIKSGKTAELFNNLMIGQGLSLDK